MRLVKLAIPVFLFSLLWTSCTSEPKVEEKPFEPQLLLGKWNLNKATRDKVKTSRLDGAFFEFLANNVFKTNILGSEEEGTYKVDVESKMLTTETAKSIKYKITKLEENALIVRMEINKAKYRIWLEKESGATSDATSGSISAEPNMSN